MGGGELGGPGPHNVLCGEAQLLNGPTQYLTRQRLPIYGICKTFLVCLCCSSSVFHVVFTALHGMQTRSSDEKAVRPSVKRVWIVTKRKKDLSRFLYHTKDPLT